MAKNFAYEIRGFDGLAEYTDGQTTAKSGESPDTVNFTLTPDHRLQKREGFRTVGQFRGQIRGIWSGILANTRHLFVAESSRVWHSTGDWDSMEQVGYLPGTERVQITEFGGKLYFFTGMVIRRYCPQGGFGELEPYRPLLMEGSGPDGLGTPAEEMNLLGGKCRQRFSSREGVKIYHLCLTQIDSVDYVKIDETVIPASQYEVHTEAGLVTLSLEMGTSAVDNVEIGFTKKNEENERRVTRCRYASVYGGNNETALFLWGNEEYPALRLHSGYADGTPSGEYFPETHYVQVGDGSAITGILRYYDRQMIFTREAAYASASESTTDALGRTRRVYPVHLISAAAGNLAVGSACLVGNTPVSVTAGGLCRWQIDSLRDETNATVFTHRIAAGLRRMSLEKLRLFYHAAKERLYIWSPKEFFYVYDGATDSFWRYEGWEPRCFFEDSAEGELYFGTETGRLCRVGGSDDDGAPIAAYWHSSELDLGSPSHSKTLFRAAVLGKALSDPCLRLQWSADVEGRSVPNNGEEARRVARPLFHFGELCFSRLGFLTGYHACNLLFPLRIRRFRRLRLCLKECSTQDLQVESIRLWGRCHDKQV